MEEDFQKLKQEAIDAIQGLQSLIYDDRFSPLLDDEDEELLELLSDPAMHLREKLENLDDFPIYDPEEL